MSVFRCKYSCGAAMVLFVLALNISLVWAHGDGERPRFVSMEGTDYGFCDNRFRPCKTIHFATAQAGKGDRVLVEKGRYVLDDADDFLFLLTGLNEIVGGYSRIDHFQKQDIESNLTFLVGVPSVYRAGLTEKGFHVITDRKTVSSSVSKKISAMMKTFEALQQSKANVPCVGNSAGVFACDRIDLLSHTSFQGFSLLPDGGNDVWGFADLNTGREYAFVGLDNGTVVMDVSDPLAPFEVGAVRGQVTGWRDIKVFQYYDAQALRWKAYAYVTADGATDRLVVVDLSELPNRVVFTGRKTGDLSAHNVYIGNVDFSYGIANSLQPPRMYITGANQSGGAFRIYSLSDPATPQLLAAGSSGYTHDASSMTIADARKDTQCALVGASCDVVFDFNEGSVEIWDVSNNSPVHLSSTTYANSGYVHSGWWSEDKSYLFVHDEFDEQRYGFNSTVRVFDIRNLASPQLAGIWTGSKRSIDHNGYVRGNRYYMSNYTRGLTVLDISTPASPVEAGYFDSFPFSDSATFNGAWGVYPFLPSGHILLGDVNAGLFVLRDQTLGSAQGQLAFASATYHAVEGSALSVTVNRVQGSQGAVAVDVEILHATADSNDYRLSVSTLSWADDESGGKSLVVDVLSDSEAENMEMLMLRLVNPVNGATLVAPSITQLVFSEVGAVPMVALLSADIVVNRTISKAFVPLKRLGTAAGAVALSYRTIEGTALAGRDFTEITDGVLQWADGDAGSQLIGIEILHSNDGTAKTFSLELFNPVGVDIGGVSTANITLPKVSTTSAASSPLATNRSGGGVVDIYLLLLLSGVFGIRRLR